MKIDWIQDSISFEASIEELEALKNLCEFCAFNNVAMDRLYEMVSSLLRPKIVITRTNMPDETNG